MEKILVVDDDKAIQILYGDELEEEGYEVITRSDGSDLLSIIEQYRPDLVVMDIRLGGHNGLEILQDIRNSFNKLPVIICTAYPAFKNDMKSIASDYYVPKSSDSSELKLKIRMALENVSQPHSRAASDYLDANEPILI